MGTPLQVSNEDVKRLKDFQLVELLFLLIYGELARHGIEQFDSQVPLSIYIKDGGIDGFVRWHGDPAKTDHFPSCHIGFQAKATDMDESACKKEVLTDKGFVKPQVRKLLESGGVYIMFLGRDCVEQSKLPRVEALKNAVHSAKLEPGDAAIVDPDMRILDASDIAAWVNSYPSAVTQVLASVGKSFGGVQGWKELSGRAQFSSPFAADDPRRADAMNALQASTGQRTVTRIIGPSGLGKTRLILEAFRPPKDPAAAPDQAERSSTFCYVSCAETDHPEPLIRDWRRSNCSGTIVVDDCTPEMHQRLAEEVRHADSRLALITVGSDRVATAYAGTATRVVEVEAASEKLILQMLGSSFPGLLQKDREFIAAEIAQGYPLMAQRVAEARSANVAITARLTSDVLRKLLGRDVPEGSTAEKVIAACALFEYVGVADDLAAERKFVRELFCDAISDEDFYSEISRFEQSGAIARYGRLIQVRPRPLAIRLAADWWARCSPERAAHIVASKFPEGLASAFCERIRMLDFVPQLVETTAKLCGSNAPFGQAKVLNSELGSRLFRAIAEVNPVAAMAGLETAFRGWDKDALRSIDDEVRRNIVWSLEKLAFRAATFPAAAHFLYRLGLAETETWSNNASGVFAGLFTVVGAQTEATLEDRLKVLLPMARTGPEEGLVLRSLDRALTTESFVSFSGPENQGSSGPLPAYLPKTWEEIYEYWKTILDVLARIVESGSPQADQALGAIASHVRGLLLRGRSDDVIAVVRRSFQASKKAWPSAVDALKDFLKYDAREEDNDTVTRVQSLIAELSNLNLEQKVILIVSNPPYESDEAENGRWIDLSAEAAKEFGKECADNWSQFQPFMVLVLRGEQRQGYAFGRGVAEGSQFAAHLLDDLLAELRTISYRDRNSSVVSGWLAQLDEIDPGRVTYILTMIGEDDNLVRSIPAIVRGPSLNDERLELICRLLKLRRIHCEDLRGLSYGQAMRGVKWQWARSLSEELRKFGVPGAWVALDILFMYAFDDPEMQQKLAPEFEQIVRTPGMLQSNLARRDAHAFEVVSKRALRISPLLAVHLAKEVVDAILSEDRLDTHTSDALLTELIQENFEHAWPVISAALASNDPKARWLLGASLRGIVRDSRPIPADFIPLKALEIWCTREPDIAPVLIAEIMRPLKMENGVWRLSDAAQMLIDRFGDNEAVLGSIGAALHTFSWTGSLVPFYSRLVTVLEPLVNHPIASVRDWASREIGAASHERDREMKRDEEEKLGRY